MNNIEKNDLINDRCTSSHCNRRIAIMAIAVGSIFSALIYFFAKTRLVFCLRPAKSAIQDPHVYTALSDKILK